MATTSVQKVAWGTTAGESITYTQLHCGYQPLYQSTLSVSQPHTHTTATMQQNVTIAVIIIILFIIITALAYGIHRLIHAAGGNGSSSSGSDSLVDDD
ncbi:hypothetical protein VC83_01518 [Pseudogymnoascus destructans]|uniref:Uncharacterized protein n=1 Tax=Pseudogymnoascus destructans TaxID=655981 RepID=A0A177AKG2_9PEZI|nr:uncharacterized protein VC83_01518 [Pseudogymnoascus destructans]OAF61781.1 hypothetical protein VC83_01518 [Pseudogymnoascus destructans]